MRWSNIAFVCSQCESALSPLRLGESTQGGTPRLSHSWQLRLISSLPPNSLIIDRGGRLSAQHPCKRVIIPEVGGPRVTQFKRSSTNILNAFRANKENKTPFWISKQYLLVVTIILFCFNAGFLC